MTETLWINLGQAVGTAIGTFALVYFGGKKAAHELKGAVEELRNGHAGILYRLENIEVRLGIPQKPMPKNGEAGDSPDGTKRVVIRVSKSGERN